MNDPHVVAIHYFVQHDGSVDYSGAKPLVYDDDLFHIRAEKRHVVLEPKCHYATEQQAKSAAEGFVRRWEFEAALQARSSAFRLVHERVDIVDRNPSPLPPGTLKPDPICESIHVSDALTVTKKPSTYPAPSSGSALDPDDRVATHGVPPARALPLLRALLLTLTTASRRPCCIGSTSAEWEENPLPAWLTSVSQCLKTQPFRLPKANRRSGRRQPTIIRLK